MKTQEQTDATKAFASVKNHPLDQYWIDQMNKQIEQATAKLRAENERLRAENMTFRNAMKACEDCDSVTMEEVKQMRAFGGRRLNAKEAMSDE